MVLQKKIKRMYLIALVSVCVVGLCLWLLGFGLFLRLVPAPMPTPGEKGVAVHQKTDAIIVFSGGGRRIETAFSLLENGYGHYLFISGVHRGVDLIELLNAHRQNQQSVACCVILGHDAENTYQNSLEARHWLMQNRVSSFVFVTSSYHMPRSLLYLNSLLPESVSILSWPVLSDNVPLGRSGFMGGWLEHAPARRLILGEYNKYLWTILHRLVLPFASDETDGDSIFYPLPTPPALPG